MNWLLAALLGQFLWGISFVFDKMLIRRRFFDAQIYVFWSQILAGVSVIALAVYAIYMKLPLGGGIKATGLAVLTGAIFAFALYFLFKALENSEASVVQPISVGFAQAFTFIASLVFLDYFLGLWEVLAFVLLFIGGLFFLTLEKTAMRPRLFYYLLLSSLFFGISNVFSKIVYTDTGFIYGFMLMRAGGVLAVLPFFFSSSFKETFKKNLSEGERTHKFAYAGNRILATAGFVLSQIAISMSHPALVDATSSFKFVVTFIFASILLKESFRGKILVLKLSGTFFVALGLILLALVSYASSLPPPDANRNIIWGLTFSQKAARDMGAEPIQILEDILRDLRPEKIRLVAYWDEIEKGKGAPDFSYLDKELALAEKYGSEVILSIGLRVPRWPECHIPAWARDLPPADLHEELKNHLRAVVGHYKDNKNILVWQVENEPFLLFGVCPERPANFLRDEISFVRSWDASRPILTTDGGELGLWYKAAREGDLFGSTMYRRVYPRIIGPMFGLIDYPLSPDYFRVKENLVKWRIKRPDEKFIIVELQAEPWAIKGIANTPYEELMRDFSPDFFKETIEYAKRAGFDEYYLWGAEWWWQLKYKQNDPRYWEIAKELFK